MNIGIYFQRAVKMDNLSGTQLGKYQLVRRLARGGMADVYLARRVTDGQELALKVMRTTAESDDEFRRMMSRFEQEARIIAGMRHPHILPLVDYGHDRGYPFIAMPYIQGGTLADIIREGPLPVQDAGGWLYQVASALDHAHQLGVIHRDLKPTNILLDGQGNAYLMDFGIAKDVAQTSSFTVTGNVLGTPTYMAPEQWRSEELSPQTDIYGLGILVHLMLTGKPPFDADTPHSLMYKHLNDPPPPLPSNIPDGIEGVVQKALAKKPADRYNHATDFSHDFQRALRGQETLASRSAGQSEKAASQTNDSEAAVVESPSAPPKPTTVPPPVYGTPQQAQISASGSYSRPMPPVQVPKQPPSWLRACVVISIFILSLGLISYFIYQDPDAYLPRNIEATVDTIVGNVTASPDATATPTATPRPTSQPGEKPSITILFPENGSIFPENGEVSISFTATDIQGITRVEARRFGFVIQTLIPPGDRTVLEYTDRVVYVPRQPGHHVIELIPYRNGIRGDSAIVDLIVE